MEGSVLIVDDSRVSRMMIRRLVAGLNIQDIREAGGGEEALKLYQERGADLVLLDLTMGGMDGFETLEKLKELDPQSNVYIVSADIQKKSRERILALGALGFIGKPFNKEQLLQCISDVLK